jgi:hypothetical protein
LIINDFDRSLRASLDVRRERKSDLSFLATGKRNQQAIGIDDAEHGQTVGFAGSIARGVKRR